MFTQPANKRKQTTTEQRKASDSYNWICNSDQEIFRWENNHVAELLILHIRQK